MPKEFPNNDYYAIVRSDPILPPDIKENIILTIEGMKEISRYYNEKYNIDITPFASSIDLAPQLLSDFIFNARLKFGNQEIYRCGFIFLNVDSGHYGHATPFIWEKNSDKESLIILDTGQFFGDVSYVNYDCDFILISSFNKNSSLANLPCNAKTAYVFSEDKLFYVDKVNNKIDRLCVGITNANLEKFKNYIIQHQLNAEKTRSFVTLDEKTIQDFEELTDNKINRIGRIALNFRNDMIQSNPRLSLYSSLGRRQLDLTSCMTDALAILKDALRLPYSLTEIAENQKKADVIGGLVLFYMPEELLKTAQIGSYPETSKADLNKEIKFDDKKHSSAKKVKTLKNFRDQFNIPVRVGNEIKHFGIFTIEKGKSYAKILKNRWEKNQSSNDLIQEYSEKIKLPDSLIRALNILQGIYSESTEQQLTCEQTIQTWKNKTGSIEKTLFDAVTEGNLEILKSAFKEDPAYLNVTKDDGTTLLHRAIFNQHSEITAFLIKYGADLINKKNDYEVTPKNIAEDKNNRDILFIIQSYENQIMKNFQKDEASVLRKNHL